MIEIESDVDPRLNILSFRLDGLKSKRKITRRREEESTRKEAQREKEEHLCLSRVFLSIFFERVTLMHNLTQSQSAPTFFKGAALHRKRGRRRKKKVSPPDHNAMPPGSFKANLFLLSRLKYQNV